MKQLALFKPEKQVYRLHNGRFATREMAEIEKIKVENKRLRFEVEYFRRAYLAVAKEYARLNREMNGY